MEHRAKPTAGWTHKYLLCVSFLSEGSNKREQKPKPSWGGFSISDAALPLPGHV